MESCSDAVLHLRMMDGRHHRFLAFAQPRESEHNLDLRRRILIAVRVHAKEFEGPFKVRNKGAQAE